MSRKPLHILVIEDDPHFGSGFDDNFTEAFRKVAPGAAFAFVHWASSAVAEAELGHLKVRFDVAFCDFWLHTDRLSLQRLRLNLSPKAVDVSDGVAIAERLASHADALAFISATTIFDDEPEVRAALEKRFSHMQQDGRFTTFYKNMPHFYDVVARWVGALPPLR